MGAWTFADLLAHPTAWQEHAQAPIEQALGAERPAPPWPTELDPEQDQDEINRFIYDATHDRSRAESLRGGRRVWDRLEEGLAALSEAELTAPDHFPWLEGKALGPTVVQDATAYYHQDHEADVRAWLAGGGGGDPELTGTARP